MARGELYGDGDFMGTNANDTPSWTGGPRPDFRGRLNTGKPKPTRKQRRLEHERAETLKSEEVGTLGLAIIEAERKRTVYDPNNVTATSTGLLARTAARGVLMAYVPEKLCEGLSSVRGEVTAKDDNSAVITLTKAPEGQRHPTFGGVITKGRPVGMRQVVLQPSRVPGIDQLPEFRMAEVRVRRNQDGSVDLIIPDFATLSPPIIRGTKRRELEMKVADRTNIVPEFDETPTPDKVKEAVKIINRFLSGPRSDELELYISPNTKLLRGSFREFFE